MRLFLYGKLQEKYGSPDGEPYEFNARDIVEACSAMEANFNGFYSDIRNDLFRVVIGDLEKGDEINSSEVRLKTSDKDVHLIPLVVGAEGYQAIAAVKIVVGVILIATGYGAPAGAYMIGGVTYGMVTMAGIGLILGGISLMLTPTPGLDDYNSLEEANKKQSFLFNGVVNSIEQGGPVPLVYGLCIVGSVVGSAGLFIEQIPVQDVDHSTGHPWLHNEWGDHDD